MHPRYNKTVMATLLLAIIYLAFVSLGLPDSLLGAGWAVMQVELQVPISAMGLVTILISGGTVVSSLFTERLLRRLGTGLLVAISVALTAVGLLGFSLSNRFWMLCLFTLPYGLGAGAIDAALNNYVALHYKGRHMSWLHCFWGVGALISPFIMGYALTTPSSWEGGYRLVFYIQIAIVAVLFASLTLWKKVGKKWSAREGESEQKTKPLGLVGAFRIKGAPLLFLAFACYCACEATAMIWAAEYMHLHHAVSAETAARYASLFYIGMTVGRAVCGFADRLGDKLLMRIGCGVMAVGLLLLGIPFDSHVPAVVGLVVLGLGCAPIYPCIIHATPTNFGREHSQGIIGVQMSSAYIGTTAMPPVFGLIADHVDIAWFPLFLAFFFLMLVLSLEGVNRIVKRRKQTLLE